MKPNNKMCIALSLLAATAAFSSCEDKIEVPDLEYKEDPNFAPPHIDPAWELVDISSQAGNGVYAYKDKLYDRLFTRDLGWNGGDGVQTTLLPDGNLWWTFNDSFYGVVKEGRNRPGGANNFPRNSVMVQASHNGRLGETPDDQYWLMDYVQTDNPNADNYYKGRTHIRHPKATLTDEQIQNGEIDSEWLYWAGDGTVVDGQLQQIWAGVHTIDGAMLAQNTCLAIYSLEGKPGDDSYLKLIDVDHNRFSENPCGYGSTLWEDEDGHTYLYSSVGNGQFLGNVPVVARSATHDLRSEWEYYVPTDDGTFVWQKEYPSDLQAKNSSILAPDQGSLTLPWVFKKGDWYYMTAQTFPFGSELIILRSEHPWGPFRDKRELLKFTNPLDDLQGDPKGREYGHLYMLHLHQGLSREGELVISTNTDPKDSSEGAGDGFWRQFGAPGSADWYRPFFFRIFKWERAFDN